jgi:hypothetical protein
MEESNKILKEQIEKLPTALKNFVLSNEWTKKLRVYLDNLQLEEWQKVSVENEVFLILMGFEEYANLPGNISENTEIDFGVAEKISEFVIKDILKPVADLVAKEFEKSEQTPSSSIGNSFERIILNQAKAMQPARLASESVAGGPAREAGSGSQQPAPSSLVPDNLPTEDLKPKPTTPNYSGQDPYREPVE